MHSNTSHRFQGLNSIGDPREAAAAAWNATRESISEHPGTSVFTAFAAGLGVGVGLALLFGGRSPPPIDPSLREKLTRLLNEHVPWMRA